MSILTSILNNTLNSVVFVYGRMNPPTIGHGKVISEMLKIAKEYNAAHCVFLSHSSGNKKNPLLWEEKVSYMKMFFPGVNINESKINNPFSALDLLSKKYKHVTFIAGSDRLEDYKRNMPAYAKNIGIELDIISSGNRLEESTSIEGVSASKARKLVLENNFELFSELIPSNDIAEKRNLFLLLQTRLMDK
ncbi:hypothetical protein EST35_0307 [Pseudomonas phage vB_PaeM_PA5oct]|uniref:Cytidyltransferase-like domain-containing protein n=1 Tax=Pseudomonas phage vB_PaeM_PA5oct TaxID=2163605 RepID=A0A4Y5JU19_9CAUD|nr:cytidyltransferase [Pseudomonas phage vB_PaeM_PA5oct]QCG76188.1 hypothetical protein EST35_0307 [Pseudomonas phage vB_PaeM_PA5oct]